VTALGLMRAAGLTPDPFQEAMCTSTAQFQLWLAHRQFGKSTVAGTSALETACTIPGSLTLLISRSQRQSSELFRKVKNFYNVTRPLPLVRSTELSMELTNGSRIISLPGNADTIVGYSAPHKVIIDEAARVPDGLFYALRPMIAMSRGHIIALSTPWGKRGWYYEAYEGIGETHVEPLTPSATKALLGEIGWDISVQDLERAYDQQQDFRWHRIRVTAPENTRLSPYFIANELRNVPRLIFESEWLCRFCETVDSVFAYADIDAMLSGRVAPLWPEDESLPELPWTSTGVLPLFSDDEAA
jgi:hypothetical protein